MDSTALESATDGYNKKVIGQTVNGDTDTSSYSVYIIFLLVMIGILILCGNILVLCSVIRFSTLRNPTNMFLCALALSDLMVGVSIVLVLTDLLGVYDLYYVSYVPCMIILSIINLPVQTTNFLLTGKFCKCTYWGLFQLKLVFLKYILCEKECLLK